MKNIEKEIQEAVENIYNGKNTINDYTYLADEKGRLPLAIRIAQECVDYTKENNHWIKPIKE